MSPFLPLDSRDLSRGRLRCNYVSGRSRVRPRWGRWALSGRLKGGLESLKRRQDILALRRSSPRCSLWCGRYAERIALRSAGVGLRYTVWIWLQSTFNRPRNSTSSYKTQEIFLINSSQEETLRVNFDCLVHIMTAENISFRMAHYLISLGFGNVRTYTKLANKNYRPTTWRENLHIPCSLKALSANANGNMFRTDDM
jgi:hypothetical protein